MAIVFHCEHCQKRIEAPDKVGGKQVKCPACQGRIRVPDPESADDEPFMLAPLDDQEEMERKKLQAESVSIAANILNEKIASEVPTEEIPREPSVLAGFQMPALDQTELTKKIMTYLHLMAEGELDEAAQIIPLLSDHKPQALKILEQLALNQITDNKLSTIPPQVLASLIRSLRTQIS